MSIKNQAFNYVISLGCSCNTSLYLKKSCLKIFSLPYDWIFTNLDMLEHTIKDDFKSFLNPELMTDIKEKKAGHDLYHSILFNHRNPKKNSEDRDYYQRCIYRFKRVLKSERRKLFIYTMYREPYKYHQGFAKFGDRFKDLSFDLDKIENFNRFLSSITDNYTFLVILQNPKQAVSKSTKILEENNLLVYVLDCLGVSSGKLLTNEADDYNYQQIIKQFDFELEPVDLKVPLEN